MKQRIFSLVLCFIFVFSFAGNCYAANEISSPELSNKSDLGYEPKLGGGPSPSAMWELQGEYTVYITKSRLESLTSYYSKSMSSSSYTAGKYAYDASMFLVSCYGLKGIKVGSRVVTFTGLTTFAIGEIWPTYFGVIQNAKNVAAELSSTMSYSDRKKVIIKLYYRPASGEGLIILAKAK